MAHVVLHTDGGSRGNPGLAGIGFTLAREGEVFCRGGAYIGETTNNVAEYQALIWGLQNALALNVDAIEVFADSELLVKQLNGEYRVKNATLKPLFMQAKTLVAEFEHSTVTHTRREFNKDADALANEAMDQKGAVGDYAVEFDRPSLF